MATPRNTQRPTLRQSIEQRAAELKHAGITAKEAAAFFGVTPGTASEACYELTLRGVLAARLAGASGKGHQAKRYFLTAFAPPLPELSDVRSCGRPAPRRATFEAGQEVIKADGFRFVRCPGYERVAEQAMRAPPVFSALRVGQYFTSGSAIERALEGAR